MKNFYSPVSFYLILNLFYFLGIDKTYGQNPTEGVVIGKPSPHINSILDISSTDKGVLFPRMTTNQRQAITITPLDPPAGLLVYDTDESAYYFYKNGKWELLSDSTSSKIRAFKQIGIDSLYIYQGDDSLGLQLPVRYGTLQDSASTNLSIRATDEGTVAGNVRGINSVDLQTKRGSGTQVASGNFSTLSGGYSNAASGNFSTLSGGYSNAASGAYSTLSGGYSNAASGAYSTLSGGDDNDAMGNSSTLSGGYFNTALGNYSTVSGGNFNIAYSYGEWVGGLYSELYTPSSTTLFNNTDRLFVVGNGISNTNRSNALTLLKNGNLGLGTSTPQQRLDLGGSAQAGLLRLGNVITTPSNSADAKGSLAYDYTNNAPQYYDGTAWQAMGGGGGGGTLQEETNLSIRAINEGTVIGNVRGANSVDLQTKRDSATQVASGDNSTLSGGIFNTASGTSSTVSGGNGNTAYSYGEWVGGLYATIYSPNSATVFNNTDRLFVVGNGTSTSTRSNALTLLKSGNLGLGTSTPQQRLDLGGSAQAGLLRLGNVITTPSNSDSAKGSLAYDYTNNAPQYYDGTAWQAMGGGGGGGTLQEETNLSIRATDEGTFTGNVRGVNSVDLQTKRGSATQVASGDNSTLSGGTFNTASGTSSTVSGGNGNTAYSYGEWVGGLYSEFYTPINMTTFNNTDRLFVVGNGTSNTNRSNALTLLKSGNLGLGTSTPQQRLDLGGSAEAGLLRLGNVITTPSNSADAKGSLAYDYTNNAPQYYDGTAWQKMGGGGTLQESNLSIRATDEGTFTGNVRGVNSVDLQTKRGSATQVASGTYSTLSGGGNNIASEYASTLSGGYSNAASGNFSTVSGGNSNTASGNASTVSGGNFNTAYSYGEWVGGLYATIYSPNSATTFNNTDRLFVVGNGTSTFNRSNALTLLKSGNLGLGTSTPQQRLDLGGSAEAGLLRLGNVITTPSNSDSAKGSLAYDYTNNAPQYYDGTAWQTLSNGTLQNPDSEDLSIRAKDEGGAFAGDARGTHSLDLQTYREAASQVAKGNYSTLSGGKSNTASGSNSTVSGGSSNLATGSHSTITGGGSDTASGGYSTVSGGYKNSASGDYSTVNGGWENTTKGRVSTVSGGKGNTAHSYGEWVGGLFTEDYAPSSITTYDSTDRLFVVGNGTSTSTRSNALTLLKSGNLGLGTSTPQQRLDLGGNAQPGLLRLGNVITTPSNSDSAKGSLAYDYTINAPQYYDGTAWQAMEGGTLQDTNLSIRATDEGTVAGNTRGINSVDLQTERDSASQVASGYASTLSGGRNNTASGYASTLSGGSSNTASGGSSTLSGGSSNTASGGSSTLSGGSSNTASGGSSTLSGGKFNTASGGYSTLSGGSSNTAPGGFSTLSGGYSNTAMGQYSTLSGGYSNTAMGEYSTLSGGYSNTAMGQYSTLSGGYSNTAMGQYSTLSGGDSNTTSGYISTLSGGYSNTASGSFSTVSGGKQNTASGKYSTVSGGGGNTAYSFGEWVGGLYATIYSPNNTLVFNNNDRLFVVGNGTDSSNRSNALTLLKSGHLGLGTSTPQQRLDLGGSAQAGLLRLGNVITTPSNSDSAKGSLAYDYTNNAPQYYDGTAWQAMEGGTLQDTNLSIRATDEGTVAGNTRGINSVDLQTERDSASQVASGYASTLSGGSSNTASGYASTLSGGRNNTASGYASTLSGGSSNTASGGSSTLSGGSSNTASGGFSTLSGGSYNTAPGGFSTLSGGNSNTAPGEYSTLSGGYSNTAMREYSTLSGGYSNTAMGQYSTLSGGYSNTAMGQYSTLSGGYSNTAMGQYSTLSGGDSNTTSGYISTLSGGYSNTASGVYSTLSGGKQNTASGKYSTVSGGGGNTAYSFGEWVGGLYATIYSPNNTLVFNNNDRLFVVGNGTDSSNRSNALTLLKSGHLGLGTSTPQQRLDLGGSAQAGLLRLGNVITTPSNSDSAKGSLAYDYTNNAPQYYDGTAWQGMGGGTLQDTNLSIRATDEGTVAGNVRGINSVDLQTKRDSVTQVASGDNSTLSGGDNNTASGSYSTLSGGWSNTASGTSSTVSGGAENTAYSYGEWVGGLYATAYSPINMTTFNNTDRLFVVGNGTSNTSRSNAFTIYKSGNATLAGTLTQNSDRRLKKDIEKLEYSLDAIGLLTPQKYHWKDTSRNSKGKSVGLIAQEVEQVLPHLVTIQEGAMGLNGVQIDSVKSVNYIGIVPYLIRATQELNEEVKDLNAQLQTEQKYNNELRTELEVERDINHQQAMEIEKMKNQINSILQDIEALRNR